MRKRISAAVGAWAGRVVLIFLAYCATLQGCLGQPQFPRAERRFSNTTRQIAILGDSQKGLANLRNLVEQVQVAGVDAILHTGDLVSHNDEGHYALASLYLRRAGLSVPFRAVAGNHDVKGGVSRFERYVGPLEDQFQWLGVWFILLNNATGEAPDPDRVRGLLPPTADSIVLLMHVPPFYANGDVVPGYEPFLRWLEGEPRVKYLFCGHLHDYIRRQVGSAKVIINGVGGDYESWQLRQKVYATILEVKAGVLADRAIELSPEHGFVENLEHLALGHVVQAYRTSPILSWGGTLVLAAITGILSGYARLRKPA